MLVTVEIVVRTIRILVGSLASTPSGVRLPTASDTSHAPKASLKRSCGSLSADHPGAGAADHSEGAKQHDDGEPPADRGDAVDDDAPAAGALDREDQQRDADNRDDDVQEGEARTGHCS